MGTGSDSCPNPRLSKHRWPISTASFAMASNAKGKLGQLQRSSMLRLQELNTQWLQQRVSTVEKLSSSGKSHAKKVIKVDFISNSKSQQETNRFQSFKVLKISGVSEFSAGSEAACKGSHWPGDPQ